MTPSQPSPTRSRRRWLQFSLRTLLVVMLLISIACGWFASRLHQAGRQAEVVAALRRAGLQVHYDYEYRWSPYSQDWHIDTYDPLSPPGWDWLRELLGLDFFAKPKGVSGLSIRSIDRQVIERLPQLPDLEEVYLSFSENPTNIAISPDEMTQLAKLPSLKRLGLMGARFTHGSFRQMRDLKTLETLSLYESRVTDTDVEALAGLVHLRRLNLSKTEVSDYGLAHLGGLRHLQQLEVGRTQVTPAGLRHLRELSDLECLEIDSSKIDDEALSHLKSLRKLKKISAGTVTDRGLASISGMAELEELEFDDASQITDRGVAHLAQLTNLRELDLSESQITDAALVHLAGLQNLDRLLLDGTQVTDEGLKHLSGLTQMRDLRLDRTRVTDAGLIHLLNMRHLFALQLGEDTLPIRRANIQYLANFGSLSVLHLADDVTDTDLQKLGTLSGLQTLAIINAKAVTGAGVAHLRSLPNLDNLLLWGTSVGDEGVEHLIALPNLKFLQLKNCKVTTEGLAKLQGALPSVNLLVSSDDEDATSK